MTSSGPENNSEQDTYFSVLTRRAAIATLVGLTLIGCDHSTRRPSDEDEQLFSEMGNIVNQERARSIHSGDSKGTNLCWKECNFKDSGLESILIRGECSEPCPNEETGPLKTSIDIDPNPKSSVTQ